MAKVGIDAGHGSNTAGKRTPEGYREHWINVKCAYYFEQALKRCGIDTFRVGWDDTNSKDDADIPLGTRQKQIEEEECDASVSWHANAFGNGESFNSAQGVETLIHNNNAYVGDSKKLAEAIQKELVKGTEQKNRGVKTQNLAMCNCSAMGTKASVLIEIGFMTNEYEADLMKTDAFCKEQAEEAAKGTCNYFKVKYVAEGNIENFQEADKKFDKVYCVQVGAYSSKKNAENMVKKLKADGYDATIITKDIKSK